VPSHPADSLPIDSRDPGYPAGTPPAGISIVAPVRSLGSLTWGDVLTLDDADADGDTYADQDQAAKKFAASPGAHSDFRAKLQTR
jgi:hypothetical protein